MKLATFRTETSAPARLGVVVADQMVDVGRLGDALGIAFPDTMLGMIDAGRAGLAALKGALTQIGDTPPIGTSTALENAILTDRALIPAATRERLALIASKYLG